MKKTKINQSMNVLAIALIAASTSFAPTASAQATLVGQCRAAKLSMAIYKEASASSAIVAPLKLDEKVTLAAETAKDGLIAVSAPSKGFVQTVNLKPCLGGTTPKPTPSPTPTPSPSPNNKSLCRLVVQAQGLVIRKEPNATAAVMGEAAANSQVTLTTSPATAKTDTAGRIWIEIAAPQKGWVSNGFGQGVSNLVFCK
jgi:hypothetical protein